MPKVETKHFKQKGDSKPVEVQIHDPKPITMDDIKRAKEDARKFFAEKRNENS